MSSIFFFTAYKETENAVWTHFIPILYVAFLKFSEALLYTKIQYKSMGQSRKTEVFNHILCACNQCKSQMLFFGVFNYLCVCVRLFFCTASCPCVNVHMCFYLCLHCVTWRTKYLFDQFNCRCFLYLTTY